MELGVPNATGFWQMLDDGERNISFKTQLAVVASPSLGAKKCPPLDTTILLHFYESKTKRAGSIRFVLMM